MPDLTHKSVRQGVAWSPWHGCHRVSEGCAHCFVYYLDRKRADRDAGEIYRTKTGFDTPVKKDRSGAWKVPPGTVVSTCFNSDFFLEDADAWRPDAWEMIRRRPDLIFLIPTKRISRCRACLPADWGDGWDNVFINVSAENQRRADERVPILLDLPVKLRGVFVAPMLGPVDLTPYLATGKLRSVSVGGESYDYARECRYEWVASVKSQCDAFGAEFYFHQTGSNFVVNNKRYFIPHRLQFSQARKAFAEKSEP